MVGPFVSYAQNAEDVVLARGLKPDDQPGFWIDVGANHPLSDSVTAAFSSAAGGASTSNRSPTCTLHLPRGRPRDINLRVALADRPGRSTLFAGPGAFRGNATLESDQAEAWRADGIEMTEIEVEVMTLGAVVDDYVPGPVDFLKVDVEGTERAVLGGVDWHTFRPRVVLVEATEPNSTVQSHGSWEPILTDAGYRFVLFDGLNRFYVRDDEAELAEALSVPANPLDDYVDHRLLHALDDCDALQAELAAVRSELDAARGERDAVLATATWRYSAAARRLYGRLLERLPGHQTR